jgi:hypothetical protein
MKTKNVLVLLSVIIPLAVGQTVFADTNSADSNGLYRVSSHVGRITVSSYEKADIKIFKAHVYSVNNSNTDFRVSLNTSDCPDDSIITKPVILRIGNHVYSTGNVGGSGKPGYVNWMEFIIHKQDEAEIAANWLSVNCVLRNPSGHKFSARFIPEQSEFHTNEPMMLKFVITNLDDKAFAFEEVGVATFQFDFQATLNGWKVHNKVSDDNPMRIFDGRIGLVNLEPGKEFDRQVDLKSWFVFDKLGTYKIHGSYHLEFFYKSSDPLDSYQPWNVKWNDNAPSDFTVVVK